MSGVGWNPGESGGSATITNETATNKQTIQTRTLNFFIKASLKWMGRTILWILLFQRSLFHPVRVAYANDCVNCCCCAAVLPTGGP